MTANNRKFEFLIKKKIRKTPKKRVPKAVVPDVSDFPSIPPFGTMTQEQWDSILQILRRQVDANPNPIMPYNPYDQQFPSIQAPWIGDIVPGSLTVPWIRDMFPNTGTGIISVSGANGSIISSNGVAGGVTASVQGGNVDMAQMNGLSQGSNFSFTGFSAVLPEEHDSQENVMTNCVAFSNCG